MNGCIVRYSVVLMTICISARYSPVASDTVSAGASTKFTIPEVAETVVALFVRAGEVAFSDLSAYKLIEL